MAQTPIRIITLNPAAAAVSELLSALTAQGLIAECIEAVDGRQGMPVLQGDEILDQQASLRQRFVELSSTEVACYLSHYRAIHQAWQEGLQRLCLLEDDVQIEPDFAEVFAAVSALPSEYTFVRLMGLKRHRYKVLQALPANRQLVCPVKGLCGTQGYVINRAGMEIFLKQAARIREPIDKFYDHYWESGLKSFAVIPHIIWERESHSAIAKASRRKASKTFSKRLRRNSQKIIRSGQRKLFMLRHRQLFFPAQRSAKEVGRTKRIH